jgi:hypothetical protein
MTELTITIDAQKLELLRQRADMLGLSTSELVLKTIDDLLSVPEEEFITLVQEILRENAELATWLAAHTELRTPR